MINGDDIVQGTTDGGIERFKKRNADEITFEPAKCLRAKRRVWGRENLQCTCVKEARKELYNKIVCVKVGD